MTVEIGLMPVLWSLLGSVRVFTMMIAGPVFSHPALSMRVRMMSALLVTWAAGQRAGERRGRVAARVGAIALAWYRELVAERYLENEFYGLALAFLKALMAPDFDEAGARIGPIVDRRTKEPSMSAEELRAHGFDTDLKPGN